MNHTNAFEKLVHLQDAELQRIQPQLTRQKADLLLCIREEHNGYGKSVNRAEIRKWVAVAATLLAALGIGLFWASPFEKAARPHASDIPSRWLVSAADGVKTFDFEDGSALELAPDSSARVLQTAPRSVRVLLERGSADVKVTHAEDTQWLLEAGPFLVEVTGTRFSLGWDAATTHFSLMLEEGAVRLTGPMIEEGKYVRRGERVDAWTQNRRMEFSITEYSDDVAGQSDADSIEAVKSDTGAIASGLVSTPSRAGDKKAVASQAGSAQPLLVPGSKGSPGTETWSSLCQRGEFHKVVTLAEEKGLHKVLQEGSADDLMALGEAARLTRQSIVSLDAYTAVRQRYAAAPEARTAAFYLGKVAFDQHHAHDRAAHWLTTYLEESPSGPFARDALGKLIELQLQTGERDKAEKNATTYLKKYPNGPHAGIAQQVLGAN